MARPREFDREKTLAIVMNLFWEKGFHETSLDDVVKVTGLQKPSLYACFGNKERLFQEALTQYSERGPFQSLGLQGSPLERLAAFYTHQINSAIDKKGRRKGCFLFNSCLEFSNKKGNLAAFVSEKAKRNETFFRVLIGEASEAGEIPARSNLDAIAGRAYATAFTLREISKFRPEKEFLADIANTFFVSVGSTKRVFNKERLR